MTIIAYASGNANPISNPHEDPTIDMSSVTVSSSSPVTQVVNGSCVDSVNASGPFTFQWYLMAKPSGSSASLVSATVQGPTLQGIDTWGNYRLFLVATNTATSETSETDPIKAPSSAFVVVRLLSPLKGIQKFAQGERNWHDDIQVWADKIESQQNAFVAHNIVDHTDVTDATGADLEVLTGGGYADDPETVTANQNPLVNGNRILHRHHGGDVDVATTSTPGVVYLDAGFSGNAQTPTVLTEDTAYLTGTAFWCLDAQYGLVDRVSVGPTSPDNTVSPLFMWHLPPGALSTWKVMSYGVHLHQVMANSSSYVFDLCTGTKAAPVSSIATISTSQMTMPALTTAQLSTPGFQHWGDWSTQNNSGNLIATSIGQVDGSTHWLGLRVLGANMLLDERARGITVTVYLKRA